MIQDVGYVLFCRAARPGAGPFTHVKGLFPVEPVVSGEKEEDRPWVYLDFTEVAPIIFPFWNVSRHIGLEKKGDDSLRVVGVNLVPSWEREKGDAFRYLFVRTCATEVSSALGLGKCLPWFRGRVLPLTPKVLYKSLLGSGIGEDLTKDFVSV